MSSVNRIIGQMSARMDTRKEKIRGRCFICLSKYHLIRECVVNRPCYYCNQRRKHHRSLCPDKFTTKLDCMHIAQEEKPNMVEISSLVSSEEMVLMQTASASVENPRCQAKALARILFDSGSYRSYITENLAEQLKLELGDEQEISLVTFGKEKPITLKTPTTKINLPLKDGTQLLLTVNVVPKITGGIQRMPIDTKIFENHLWKDLQLADSLPTQTEKTQIDLLLGNDYYLDIIEHVRMELKPVFFLTWLQVRMDLDWQDASKCFCK